MKILFVYLFWLCIQVGIVPTAAWVFPNTPMPTCTAFSIGAQAGPTCSGVSAWQVFKAQISNPEDPTKSQFAMSADRSGDDEDGGEDGTSSISNGF